MEESWSVEVGAPYLFPSLSCVRQKSSVSHSIGSSDVKCPIPTGMMVFNIIFCYVCLCLDVSLENNDTASGYTFYWTKFQFITLAILVNTISMTLQITSGVRSIFTIFAYIFSYV